MDCILKKNMMCRTVPVQKHLQLVYLTLSAALLAAAVGAYVNMVTGIGGW